VPFNLWAIRTKDVEIDRICTRTISFVNEKAMLMPLWLSEKKNKARALKRLDVRVLVLDVPYY
jgi:hypothetical protein